MDKIVLALAMLFIGMGIGGMDSTYTPWSYIIPFVIGLAFYGFGEYLDYKERKEKLK